MYGLFFSFWKFERCLRRFYWKYFYNIWGSRPPGLCSSFLNVALFVPFEKRQICFIDAITKRACNLFDFSISQFGVSLRAVLNDSIIRWKYSLKICFEKNPASIQRYFGKFVNIKFDKICHKHIICNLPIKTRDEYDLKK